MTDDPVESRDASPGAQSRRLGMAVLAAGLAVLAGGAWLAGRGEPLPVSVPDRGVPYQVDVNAAGWAELSLVPGLGGVLARRIVEYRDRHGPYRSLNDLVAINGIADVRLREIRPYLTLAAESPTDGDRCGRPGP
ncbi:MAG TPA: helix-hairpin-helix domain-containing protein [Phycisphaerae bacterium]|nr:helix-hairpin-helix domain-containing protein [Phycisphaerae bacterium]HOI54080.1 helix-hairpin-helix domain-containing protein [Phycisphaerae bacterium]